MFCWILIIHFLFKPRYLRAGHVDGSAQDCSISIALAMEILQSRAKPLIYNRREVADQ